MVHQTRLTDKELDKFIDICQQDGISYSSRDEARESAQRLFSLYDVLFEGAMEQLKWDKRLEKEPKGFPIASEGRTCSLCKRNVQGEVWYDKWGMRCLDCQDAYRKKIVPGYVFNDHDNKKHITGSQLNWRFGLHAQTIKKLVRNGVLKARVVTSKNYGDTLVFLKRENPDMAAVIEQYKK